MKLSLSSVAIGIVALACFLVDFSLKNWQKEDRVIEWDVHGYYEYLPAFFIYDDIKFEKSDYRLNDNRYLFWPVFTPDGKKVIKMSMGTAYFYAPFFFVAHAFALISDYPEDGFSEPYKIFLLLSAIFYLVIGFDFVKKILTHYGFSDKIIATVILLVGLGTNILCYASQSAPMSHVYSFCVFSIFIYYSIKWHQQQSIKNTIIIGLLLGWISLIRPTNAAIVLFFILYGISTLSELRERIFFFIKKYFLLLIMVLCTLLPWAPQCLYWKKVTGHFIYYSYTGEGFFFNHPHILEGMFGFRKGWLIYTPMMAFGLAGIFFMKEELKKLKTAIIIFMLINIYIIFSWWCWWYGGTFGQRSFIESYGLLAIPFASFVKFLSERKWYYNLVFYCVAAFLIWLNIFQTYQFEFHSLHHDGMNKELYFKQFGKMEKIPGFDSMVHWPYYPSAQMGLDCEIPPPVIQEQPVQQTINESGRKEVGRKTIQLKAYNGKYVCADGNFNNIVTANRDSAQGWETFTLILFEKNECAILAYNNKFFSVDPNRENEILFIGDQVSDQEIFSMLKGDNNYVFFKSSNGKYLSVNEKSLKLFAGSDSIGKPEKFQMIQK